MESDMSCKTEQARSLSSAKHWKTTSKNQNSWHASFSVREEDWHWLLPVNVPERTQDNLYESSFKIFEDNEPNILTDVIKPQLMKDKTVCTLHQKQV